jgi:tRNA splicing ligase
MRRFATFDGFFFFFAFAMTARGFRLWRETLKKAAVSGKLGAMD